MPQSNYDLIWTEQQKTAAAIEGWGLVLTVDEGKPIGCAYFEIFDIGPKFPNRRAAAQHVVNEAMKGSRLHVDALSVCTATRGVKPKAKGKK